MRLITGENIASATLPPPTYHADRCAAGSDGLTGCRLCVQACPYQAIASSAIPHGTAIHIDAGLCQR